MPTKHSSAAAIALGAMLFLSAAAVAAPRYSITLLPSGTSASDINETGLIVGSVHGGGTQQGFVWSRSTFATFAAPGGGDSFAVSINNRGGVAGYTYLPNGDNRAFVYTGGVAAQLTIPGSSYHYAEAINDAGVIGGSYAQGGTLRGFVYANGSVTDIGTLGGSYSVVHDINNAGQVVGFSNIDDDEIHQAHAFLYANGVMTDLGTMDGASLSEATAINERGQITGHGWVEGSQHAFLYQAGVMQDLGTLGGRYSFAYDINNAGHIVGWSNEPGDEGGFAFLYDGTSMVNLNSLIDPGSGWVLVEARGINDRQQIAAFGCRADECRALLLELAPTQVKEPAPFGLVLAGLGLMGWRRVSGAYRYGGSRPHRKGRKT